MSDMLWTFLNSVPGVALCAAILALFLRWLYTRHPSWRQWEGYIIAAVKYAEKAIPDDTPNQGLRKLDKALGWLINIYEQQYGKSPSDALVSEWRQGIEITVERMDAGGTL